MSDWLLTLLTLTVPVLIPLAVTFAMMIYKTYAARLPGPVQAFVHAEAMHVVRTVNQVNKMDPNGAKKAEAMQLLEAILLGFHLPVNETLLHVAIESAVQSCKLFESSPVVAEAPVVAVPVEETPLPVANAFSVRSGLNGTVQAVVAIPGVLPTSAKELDSQAHLDLSSGTK